MQGLKQKNIQELEQLAQDLRDKIVEVVSKNGGHLSSNMGSIELIIAMHYVFDVKKDPFIFDVSHQSYAHKLLTNRCDKFDTLRQFEGLSGYTKPSESDFDYFVAGHSSTSISLALGAAKAAKLKQEDKIPVALIGDGALSAGMVYEALNELGDRKYPVVIILNDNEMSISTPIGAISKYLSQKMAEQTYQKFKSKIDNMLEYFPKSAKYIAKKMEDGFKLITPGVLFEELGIEYIGPVDGHDIRSLIDVFEVAKNFKKPVIVHTQTLKGKGYQKAEGKEEKWHGVGPFDVDSGEFYKKTGNDSATAIFAKHLIDLASQYEDVVGVTAAMPSGTGIDKLIAKFPDRFWDVAIAEQHAVTSMAAMAKDGFKPFVAIYSTFLQRAYDQIIHDCAIMNVNINFAIDRAGIVGEDGETHQGAFDISFLNAIPNIVLLAPRCEQSFKEVIWFSYHHEGVCAFRYPRGSFRSCMKTDIKKIQLAKGEILQEGEDEIAFIGYGNGVGRACEIKEALKGEISPALVDLVFVKPLDKKMLEYLAIHYKKWYIFSDSAKSGGVGSILADFLQKNNIFDVSIKSFEFEDSFIPHGSTSEVEKYLQIDVESIIENLRKNN